MDWKPPATLQDAARTSFISQIYTSVEENPKNPKQTSSSSKIHKLL